jgi:hypothetical protein
MQHTDDTDPSQRVVSLLAAGVGETAPGARDQLRLQCVQLLYTLVRSEAWFQRPLVALDVGAVLHVVAADATAAPAVRVAACTLFLHLAARGPEQAAALQVWDLCSSVGIAGGDCTHS